MYLKRLSIYITAVTAFTISVNQSDGVYQVSYDTNGFDTHVFLRGPATVAEMTDFESRNSENEIVTSKATIHLRQSDGVECGGYDLDHNGADQAVVALQRQCNPGAVGTGSDFYSISGGTVVYFCNFGATATVCQAAEIRDSLSGSVTRVCGSYRAGWRTINNPQRWVSIGYEKKEARFCGRGS